MKKSLIISVYSILTLSTLLVFWQVRNFDFVNYDDNVYIYENPHVLNGLTSDGISWAFTTGCTANWHPITWLSLMLDCQLFGTNPGSMHLVNLLLHLVNALLLFVVLKKMTGSLWPSAFVAVAFAIHPMHVESVAWITERKDVLSTFFFLLTLAAYVGYVRGRGILRYLLTVVLFVFGLLAKPMLVTLPFVLLLLDYWPLERIRGQKTEDRERNTESVLKLVIEKIPFLAIAAISSAITFMVQRSGGAMAGMDVLPLKFKFANAVISYARYIGKMFWPENLAVFYPFDADSFALWQVAMCVLLLLVISIFMIRFGRKQRYLPVGWFWFLGTLMPVIGLVQAGEQSLADRYTYIPYTGLLIIIAWGLPELLSRWLYRKIALGIAAVMVLTVLGIGAYRQAGYWKNSSALFTHAIEVTQNNYIAHEHLAQELYKQGNPALAIEHYKKALEINPYYAESYNNRGIVYSKLDRWQEAIKDFSQAIRIKPDYVDAIYNRGIAFGNLGRWQEAIKDFSQAIRIKPDLTDAYNNLGIIMNAQGNYKEAIEQLERVVRLQPDAARPCNDLALLIAKHPEIKNHSIDGAISLARRACEITNYRNADFLNTLALAYSSAGRFSEAVNTAESAIHIDQNSASAHRVLGAALLSEGDFQEALVHTKRSLEIEPNNIDAKNNLAWILATSPDPNIRNPSDAIRLAQEVCNTVNFKEPTVLDTLGAAYASDGRFADAVETAQKALDLAGSANQTQIKNTIERHLILYKQNKPYVESVKEAHCDANKP